MKKKSLVCGLIPALALGMCSTGFAATDAAAPASEDDWKAIEELRAQLEADLQQAAEMEERLNAQLDSLDKRVTKVEKGAENPRIEVHGEAKLRHERHGYEGLPRIDRNTMKLNLFTDYKISDGVVVKAESEFENNLTHNSGAYEGDAGTSWNRGGKQYDRVMKQLYVDGQFNNFEVKLGRYTLQSPYKMTFDDQVDGLQVKYTGLPNKFGKSTITFSAGNTGNTYDGTNIMYADQDFDSDRWSPHNRGWEYDFDIKGYKLLSLMAEVPVAKDTNIVTHYGKVIKRNNNDVSRNTFSIGFDTKIAPNLKFTAATAKSNSSTLNKSHMFQLQYRESETTKPGS